MTFTANRILVPGDMISEDQWSNYSCSWTAATTNPAIGNGTFTARYFKLSAHTCAVMVGINMGSTSTKGSGAYSFSLPFAVSASVGQATGMGTYWINDSGSALRTGSVISASSTTVQLYANGAGAPIGDTSLLGTFASSRILFNFLYEV